MPLASGNRIYYRNRHRKKIPTTAVDKNLKYLLGIVFIKLQTNRRRVYSKISNRVDLHYKPQMDGIANVQDRQTYTLTTNVLRMYTVLTVQENSNEN